MDGYREALIAAGAEVLAMESFGSYQGDWWAKVVYQGETFYVTGAYGSCSGCDAFEAEFDYPSKCYEHNVSLWHPVLEGTIWECDACRAVVEMKPKLIEFGKEYLDDSRFTFAEALKKMQENLDWDAGADEMVAWIKKQEGV